MFAIKISESGVSRAKRSSVGDDVFEVTRVFVTQEVFQQRVEVVASFRDLRGSGDNLFFVHSDGESAKARSRKARVRGRQRIGLKEFKGFVLEKVGFFESVASVCVVLLVLGGEFLFYVKMTIGIVETLKVTGRWWR